MSMYIVSECYPGRVGVNYFMGRISLQSIGTAETWGDESEAVVLTSSAADDLCAGNPNRTKIKVS